MSQENSSFKSLSANKTESEGEEPEVVRRDDVVAPEAASSEASTTETSAEDTASQNEPEEVKESVEELRDRLARAEADRDNYKKGMLSMKAKKHELVAKEPEQEEQVEESTEEVDVEEQKVISVLNRERERNVLSDVIDSTSKNYMPELVDDRQYNEIVGYLPKNIDRSSENAIRRALRVAVHAWKFDRGITDSKPKAKPEADLIASKGVRGSAVGNSSPKKTGERKLIKKTPSIEDWYN